MFTGISGSKTVEIASIIAGFSAAVLSASAVNSVLVDSGAEGVGSGIIGIVFMSLSRGALFAFQRRLERVPREAGALHSHRKFANASEHRQLSEILHRLIGRSRDHVMKTFEEGAGLAHRVSLDGVGHERCRCLRNCTTAPLKRDIGDHITV